ncbi:hypothetical protein OBRU01_08496, partial [Operophtera brumata]
MSLQRGHNHAPLAIARVIDNVCWAGQDIRVYNEVIITPPYKLSQYYAIARVIDDVCWAGQNIRVYNEVIITPPYK